MAQRTAYLPSMEPVKIPEITKQAELYVDKRDARIKLNGQEKVEYDKLAELMKKHKIRDYRDDDLIIETVTLDEKIKVKMAGEDPEETKVKKKKKGGK